MKRFTFLASTAAALLCMPLGLLAQQVDTNPVELPSTSVWQQMKFSSMPGASLYTGTMHLSIPVYTYHDADFDIPLSLDYSTNGYRPNIMTGLVGHEWSLGLGGAITRTVRGLPDELRSAGLYGFQELHNRHDITAVQQINIYYTQFDDESIEATSPHLYYAPDGWDAGGDSIDMEPDIFQFSFLGRTGKFQLGYDGTINVYGTNTRSSEYKVQVNTYDLDTITITDGDGIRYIFGNADGKAREQAGGRTTTWKLSRIETPSGRYVDFTYTRSPRSDSGTLSYSMFNSYAPDSHCYSFFGSYYDEMGVLRNINYDFKPIRPTLSSVMTVSAPDKVTVDNGTEIVFYYKNPSQLETGDGVTLLNLPKLDRIEVRAPGGTTVRSCTLGYSYPLASASNKLCFLSSVSIPGEGSYTFEYNVSSSTVFPKHGTFKIDHWGYYNNSSASAQTFYTHTLQGDYLEETINTSLREPSTAAALLGVMTAVHYPTGGRTTFEYEGNDYSRYEDNDGYPSFAPAMESTPSRASRTTGGVRIKAIRDYDDDAAATPVYTRSYSYLDAEGHSSGVRGPLPRYGLEYQKYRIDGSNIDVYLGSYNNLAPADGTHIEYRRVTETLPQGSNVYEYITRDDCPDGKVTWYDTNMYNFTFHTGFSPDIYMSDEEAIDAIFAVMTPVTSMQASRGQLLSSRTYDAQGNLKRSSVTAYEPYEDAFMTIDKIWNYQSMYLGATRVPTVTGDIKPLSTTTVSDGVSDTEAIVYDAFRNVRSRSRGGQTSKYFYFEDLANRASYSDFRDISYWDTFAGSAVCARMAALNMKNSPLQTEAYDEDGILHVLRYEYETRATAGGSAVFLKSIKEHDGSVWRTVMSIDARDSRGRILETSDADGIKTAYVWGYGGLYPVAEVINATLMEVKGVSGLSGIETAPLAEALTGNQAAALRNLGDATVWECSPLVGVTRETAPDGRSTYCIYTAAGKPYKAKDDLGRSVSARLYSIENAEQFVLSGNWTIERTYTNSGGTASFEDITFYDGLGYPEQIVQVGASPVNSRNIVTPMWYDAMRRDDARSYLPYVSTSTGRAEESTSTVLSSQAAWYNSSGWSGQGAYAFSEQEYEQSPLNRVLEARKPGSTYAKTVSGSKYANLSYTANASSDVRKLTVSASGTLVSNGYYPAGTLHKTTATDEDNSITVTWTDVLGHTVLSRQTANSQTLDTYYVYDDAGQLRWVVTPEGSALLGSTGTWSLNDGTGITDVNSSAPAKYCYIYTWDGLGRQLSRKIPGKAVEYFVYDRAGRLVMTQDGLQRSSSKWVTMRYDNAGRLIRRALLSSNKSRDEFQDLFNSSNYPSEVYNPSSGDTLLESFDYGTYSQVPSDLAFTPVSGVTPQVDQTRIKGLKTYEKVAVLSGTATPTQWTQRAFYYDQLGRLIQTVEKDAANIVSRYSTGYDFLGNVTASREQHGSDYKSTTFTYDSRGRLLSETTGVNGAVSATMTYAYDPLGRPKTTTSGTGSTAVTTTDTYNIQGWLTARSAQKSGGTNVFSMNLGYYSPVQSGAAARYSGDISSWTWTQSGQGQKAYAYTYDTAHRLTDGQYYSGSSATNALSEKGIEYDRAGNITTLTRYSSSGSATTLSYSYTGNRRSTFAYDINGNVTDDATNSLQTSYNLLNLPVQTKSGSTVKAYYSYLSDGTKASVLNASGAGYDYNGTFTYSHASGGTRALESVAFGGGRIRKTGSSYAVDYYVTDHLGSVRAIVNASGTIVEQNDFYPFGTRQQNGLTTLSANRWRFSGKEGYDSAFGIALDDFGARLYDRTAWTSIDPLAEKYYSVSPYAYCAGNPVRFVDSEGSEIRIIIGEGENRQQLSYQNGQLYQMDGTEYCGDDHFATIVLATLNNLHAMSDPNINNVLNTIEKSKQKHYIELYPFSDKDDHVVPISEYGYSLANSGIPIDTHILLKLNNTPIENNLSVTNETTLGHELKHAYDYDQGKYKGIIPWSSNEEIDPAEISAVVFENRIRKKQNLPQRISYGKPISKRLLSFPVIY